jgi:hypothetical protein
VGEGTASADAAARANLAAYERYLSNPFPKAAVDTILAAFDTRHGR